ncbi:hypothetical protein SC206_02190 [Rouxiella sp. T17]|uniref:hypothetical protein n=1 Tax=Rouxiella sp. T17 TaxID=3085684 RepID=UPI002FCC0D9B
MKTTLNAIKYDGVFILEQESPISLHEGIIYIYIVTKVEARADEFDDEQFGLPF